MKTFEGRRWGAMIVVLGLVLTACGGETDADGAAATGDDGTTEATFERPEEGVFVDRIDYGLIYDQTGPTASTQTLFGHGFLSYVQRVNEDGGVNGRTINVLEEDERYEVPVGVAAYNKLVDQTPVVGITGLNNSSLQGAVIESVDENQVPVIGAQSTTKAALNPFRDYFFAMECTYSDLADVAVAYGYELGGESHRAVAVYGNVAGGEQFAVDIQNRLEQAGGTFAGSYSVEFDATEADALAQSVAADDPDVIHLHGGIGIGIAVLSSLQKFGITDVPVIGSFPLHADPVPQAATDIPFYVINCYSNAYDGVDGSDDVVADAEAAGYPEEEYRRAEFVNGYVVAKLVVEALERAGDELTRESLHDALTTIDAFDTGELSPTIGFAEDDRVGVAAVRPNFYNHDTQQFEPQGSFEDYAGCLTNEYIEESLGDYDPIGCISS